MTGLYRLLLLFSCLLHPSYLHADGGTLRLSQDRDGLRISVFTSPTPLRPGTIDVSVLVQDLHGRVRLGLPIVVRAWPMDAPDAVIQTEASAELATNKLLQAADLELLRPGRWHLTVHVEGREVGCEVDLAAPLPSWWALAPWIGWPFLVIGLVVLGQLAQRRVTSSACRDATGPPQ